MRKLWLTFAILIGLSALATAQVFTMPPPAGVTVDGFVVVSSCGGQSLTAGKTAFGTMDTTGKLCDIGNGTITISGTVAVSPTVVTPVIEQSGSAYPNRANWLTGSATATTSGAIIIINAPASNKLYVAGIQCGRDDAGTAAARVTFNDPQSSQMVLANSGGGGVNNMTFTPAIPMSATTSLTFTPNTPITSIRCNAQGYNAP